MALRKVGGIGGPVFKWDAVGKKIMGFLLAIRDGKQFAGNAERSKLATFRALDGQVITSGAPKALAGRLSEVLIGTYVEITYLGTERGQSGVQYKSFDVQADDERRMSPAEVAGALAAAAQQRTAQQPAPPAYVQQPSVGVPAPAADGAAPGGVEALEQKLRDAKGTQIGDLMINALKLKHASDPVAYLSTLADTLKASGVAI